MNPDKKDWQIAAAMFGKNGKKECAIVSELRRHCRTQRLCDGYRVIYDTALQDDCGWIIPEDCCAQTQ